MLSQLRSLLPVTVSARWGGSAATLGWVPASLSLLQLPAQPSAQVLPAADSLRRYADDVAKTRSVQEAPASGSGPKRSKDAPADPFSRPHKTENRSAEGQKEAQHIIDNASPTFQTAVKSGPGAVPPLYTGETKPTAVFQQQPSPEASSSDGNAFMGLGQPEKPLADKKGGYLDSDGDPSSKQPRAPKHEQYTSPAKDEGKPWQKSGEPKK